MKKIILLTALLCCVSNVVMAQSSLKIRFEGKSFDELYLGFFYYQGGDVTCRGQTTDGTNWVFNCVDSIYERATMMQFVVPSKIDTIYHTLVFSEMINCKMVASPQFYFLPNDSVVMKFVEQKISYANPIFGFITTIVEKFTIEKNTGKFYIHPYIVENIFDPQISAQDNFVKFSSYVKNNPDSRLALIQLAKCITFFDKGDVKSIFEAFTPARQQSYFGNIVRKYLIDHKFQNFQLPDSKNGNEQWVVQADKPTLMIFSASWCAPCHEAIPIYKEIFEQMGDKVDMVYITIDEASSLGAWNKLIDKENIKWRSLWAASRSKTILNDYYLSGIPSAVLVMPDNSTVRLDVRDDKDKEQFLNLINGVGK